VAEFGLGTLTVGTHTSKAGILYVNRNDGEKNWNLTVSASNGGYMKSESSQKSLSTPLEVKAETSPNTPP